MSEDRISISLVNKDAKTKIRIVRHATIVAGVIRLYHGRIRLSDNVLDDLDLFEQEFGEIIHAPDRVKALNEYRWKLDKKPWSKLGVNVE